MKKIIFCATFLAFLLIGCSHFRPQNYVLVESEEYFYIPAGEVINAQIGDKMSQIKRNHPSWNVDAGYLTKLQEQANANTLKEGGK